MTFNDLSKRGLVLLGCGKMGSAMLAGWLKGGLAPDAVHVLDPNPSDWVKAQGIHLNSALPVSPAVVIVAVKPQMMGEALPVLKPLGNGGTLFLSIAAGTRMSFYEDVLGAKTHVVRAMPNTPAAIGKGISAIIGNGAAKTEDLALAEELLSAIGQVVRLEGEH